MGSTCSGSSADQEVVGAYDCCTKLGDSIGEFFLGRTLTTDFRELVEGDSEGFSTRWGNYLRRGVEDTGADDVFGDVVSGGTIAEDLYGTALRRKNEGLADTIDFICDPRLKLGLTRVRSHVMPDVHGYEWTWAPRARRLYGLAGRGRGVLTTEMARAFPHMVRSDEHGYNHLLVGRADVGVLTVMQRLGATALCAPSAPRPARS